MKRTIRGHQHSLHTTTSGPDPSVSGRQGIRDICHGKHIKYLGRHKHNNDGFFCSFSSSGSDVRRKFWQTEWSNYTCFVTCHCPEQHGQREKGVSISRFQSFGDIHNQARDLISIYINIYNDLSGFLSSLCNCYPSSFLLFSICSFAFSSSLSSSIVHSLFAF